MGDSEFLNWIADRLVFVHGDMEGQDFIIRLRKMANEAHSPFVVNEIDHTVIMDIEMPSGIHRIKE